VLPPIPPYLYFLIPVLILLGAGGGGDDARRRQTRGSRPSGGDGKRAQADEWYTSVCCLSPRSHAPRAGVERGVLALSSPSLRRFATQSLLLPL